MKTRLEKMFENTDRRHLALLTEYMDFCNKNGHRPDKGSDLHTKFTSIQMALKKRQKRGQPVSAETLGMIEKLKAFKTKDAVVKVAVKTAAIDANKKQADRLARNISVSPYMNLIRPLFGEKFYDEYVDIPNISFDAIKSFENTVKDVINEFLSESQRDLLLMYYNVVDIDALHPELSEKMASRTEKTDTLEKISELRGLTRTRIKQIADKCIRRVRSLLDTEVVLTSLISGAEMTKPIAAEYAYGSLSTKAKNVINSVGGIEEFLKIPRAKRLKIRGMGPDTLSEIDNAIRIYLPESVDVFESKPAIEKVEKLETVYIFDESREPLFLRNLSTRANNIIKMVGGTKEYMEMPTDERDQIRGIGKKTFLEIEAAIERFFQSETVVKTGFTLKEVYGSMRSRLRNSIDAAGGIGAYLETPIEERTDFYGISRKCAEEVEDVLTKFGLNGASDIVWEEYIKDYLWHKTHKGHWKVSGCGNWCENFKKCPRASLEKLKSFESYKEFDPNAFKNDGLICMSDDARLKFILSCLVASISEQPRKLLVRTGGAENYIKMSDKERGAIDGMYSNAMDEIDNAIRVHNLTGEVDHPDMQTAFELFQKKQTEQKANIVKDTNQKQ